MMNLYALPLQYTATVPTAMHQQMKLMWAIADLRLMHERLSLYRQKSAGKRQRRCLSV